MREFHAWFEAAKVRRDAITELEVDRPAGCRNRVGLLLPLPRRLITLTYQHTRTTRPGMIAFFPYWPLILPARPLAMGVAMVLDNEPGAVKKSGALIPAGCWLRFFSFVIAHFRQWRPVRVFIALFVGTKFAGSFWRQLMENPVCYRLGAGFAGATMIRALSRLRCAACKDKLLAAPDDFSKAAKQDACN